MARRVQEEASGASVLICSTSEPSFGNRLDRMNLNRRSKQAIKVLEPDCCSSIQMVAIASPALHRSLAEPCRKFAMPWVTPPAVNVDRHDGTQVVYIYRPYIGPSLAALYSPA